MQLQIDTDIIQNSISAISLAVSSVLVYREYKRNRFSFDITVFDYVKYPKSIQLFVLFQNQSGQPLAISSVALKDGNPFTQCELLPVKIRETNQNTITTPVFPINLSPYQGLLCYLAFLNPKNISITQGSRVALRVYTNRGAKDLSLSLSAPGRYLHIR